ncbi:endonuclease/exonuclease/phosphatase family protein [Streptomyces sp. NPDC002564]|uniref:endonuclease/exonuclease/phosphatase family protein n=1 Tax=Streptomyces sp. NPDC002564 TaxID=3364649 RepID=UPI0036A375A7
MTQAADAPVAGETVPKEPASEQPAPAAPAAPADGPGVDEPGRGRRIGRLLRLWYGRVLLVAAGLWLVYAVVRWLVSGRWHWAILLDATPPVLLVAVPVLLLTASALACGRRRPWAAAASSAGLLLALTTGSGLNWPALWRDPGPVPPGALHVVSLNTQYWGKAAGVDRLYALLHRQKADVYLLQEHVAWTPGRGEDGYIRLDDDARLRAEFPGYFIARRGELLTLSRFPIAAEPPVGPGAELDAAPGTPFNRVFLRDKVLRTDLRLGKKTLSVYNTHITVPLALDNLNPFSGFDFDAYFRRKAAWRKEELRGLERDVAGNGNPAVIAGDFNSTASMRDLDGLRATADDALRANTDFVPLSWKFNAPAEFEMSGLFNRSLPFWRLDWAFTAGPVDLHRYDFRPTDGISEHRMQDLWLSL